jgi:hypothetical protein
MSDVSAKILPVSALANVSEENVKQRSCRLSQNGQPLFVIG